MRLHFCHSAAAPRRHAVWLDRPDSLPGHAQGLASSMSSVPQIAFFVLHRPGSAIHIPQLSEGICIDHECLAGDAR